MDANMNEVNAKGLAGAVTFSPAASTEAKGQGAEALKAPRASGEQRSSESSESGSVDRQTLQAAADKMQNELEQNGISLKFKITEESGDIQVEMVSTDNDKVIRKLPPDELVKLSSSLKKMAGGFLDKAV